MGVGAVVGEEKDDGVVGEFEVVEALQNAADVPVLVLDHGEGAAGVGGVLLVGGGGVLRERLVFEFLPVGVGHGPRGVRGGERDEGEERAVLVFVDEGEGAVGADVDDVAGGADHAAVVVEGRVEVFAPVAGGVAEVFVEAAGPGVVGPLGAVVPFAEGAGGVAGGLEGVGDGFLREVEAFLSGGYAADAAARVPAAGEEFGAGGRADGLDVEAIERDAAAGDAVDVGRGDLAVAREAVVAPAGVVGEEDHDVGPRRGEGGRRAEQQGERRKAKGEGTAQ